MPCTAINVYGKPAIGEILHAEQELDNAVNKCAVKVVKNNKTIAILTPCEYSRILWYFIARGGKIAVDCKQLCVGMEIPCRLVFSFSSKLKINCLKEVLDWRARFANKHVTQTAPLGATTHEKVIEQQRHTLSFFCLYFSTS